MAVKLALAGFLIPYIFCYNPGLLKIDASGTEVASYVATAILGIVSFSFASVGFWLRNLHIWERLLLLAGAITLITPGIITDAIGLGLMVLVHMPDCPRPTAAACPLLPCTGRLCRPFFMLPGGIASPLPSDYTLLTCPPEGQSKENI